VEGLSVFIDGDKEVLNQIPGSIQVIYIPVGKKGKGRVKFMEEPGIRAFMSGPETFNHMMLAFFQGM
jgi:hypothetical protein